jgi:hypothetical protein
MPKKLNAKSVMTETKAQLKNEPVPVERVQLGVRLERRMVKVLKAMAEYGDISLGELIEEMVLHSFEGGSAQTFSPEDIKIIRDFKKAYGMNYDIHSNHRFIEKSNP